MFGANDNTQMSNDDPAMLDNVKQLASEPASSVSPPPQFMTSSAQQQNNQFAATPAPSSDTNAQQFQQSSATMPQNDDATAPPSPTNDSFSQAQPAEEEHHSAVAEPAQGFSSAPFPADNSSENSASQTDNGADATEVNNEPEINQQTQDQPQVQAQDNGPIAATPMSVSAPVDTQQLAGMKQQALDHLEPLVGHLDQSAEESFKTTMMMIQANDNHTLLEKALEQAKNIEDDKVRANAMLDIINEINYFSQTNQEQQQ